MNLLFSIALVTFLMLGISGQEDTPDNNDTMRIYLVMIPDSKVESLRRRRGRQEEAAAGAAGTVLEAGAGGAATYIGLILNGVLGADVRPIFQGTTAFIPEGEVRDGITDILQRGIAPVLNGIFKQIQQNVQNRFNITSTTPQPSSIPILQNQNLNPQEQTEIQTNQNLQPSSFAQTQSQLEQHQLQQQQLNQLNNEFQNQPQFSNNNNNFNQYQQPIYNQFQQPQNQQLGATNQFQSPASPQLQPPFDSKYQQPLIPSQPSGQQTHAPLRGNPVTPNFQNQRTRIDPLQQTHQFQRADPIPQGPTSNFSVSEVDEQKVIIDE